MGLGLRGEYYNSKDLTGARTLLRTDTTVNFSWGQSSPGFGVNPDNFSVRWTGKVEAPVTGPYTFATTSDDGVRLWINGKPVIDNWTPHSPKTDMASPVTLEAGKRYDVKMEYYDGGGGATAKLLWAYPAQVQAPVPRERLFPPDTVWVSDLPFSSAMNGFGPVERNKSNGGSAAGDGKPLTIAGTVFSKGLGAHAPADIRFALAKKYGAITGMVGVDDEVPLNQGSVQFQIFLDGTKAWESPVVRGDQPSRFFSLSVTGKNELRLVVLDAGDGKTNDHADWADLQLTLASAPAPAPAPALPAAPTNLTATPGDKQVALTWTAVTGATSYRVFRGTASGGQSATPVVTGITGTGYTNTGLTNGTKYFYKVAAVNATGQGPMSGEASATPVAPTPVPPPTPPPTPGPGTPPTALQSFRFLRQASFGPTAAAMARVQQIGIPAYIDEQFAATPSTYPQDLIDKPNMELVQEHFFRNTLNGPDQLRQRVAWALSQIWVVSAVEVDCTEAFVPYLRALHTRASGNFYDLMREVTLLPAMGEYLDMVNNGKANPAEGTMPNENFARELMQLFTLGLFELNPDGSSKLDSQGRPIPTYTQAEVMELARALTGWTYSNGRAGAPTEWQSPRYDGPMEPVEKYHDTGAKTFLGRTLPAGQTATQDLDQALQTIFNHPNIGPFISRQLIQKLVTSGPSATYVQDVAAVFNNNGQGVRGDLRAVVKAILTHSEAQLGTPAAGKLMEPVLFVTSLTRALASSVADQPFMTDLSADMGQRVFYSPSVFNYFSPGFRIPGTSQVAPEFQLFTTATGMIRTNFVASFLNGGFGGEVTINLAPYQSLAGNPAALVDKVNADLMGGLMGAEMRQAVIDAVRAAPSNKEKAQTALYLTATSLQYQVEH